MTVSTTFKVTRILAALGAALLLSACASNNRNENVMDYPDLNQLLACHGCGVVELVDSVAIVEQEATIIEFSTADSRNLVSGDNATGDVSSTELQEPVLETRRGYRFLVTLDDGSTAMITQQESYGLDYGDRIKIIDDEIVPA